VDLHIDDFCQDVARILLDLYAVFPLQHAIYVEDISGPDTPDEVGLHSRRYNACLGTMLWLAEEGWIRFDSLIYRQGIDQAVLTNKAFVLLSTQSDIHYVQAPDTPESLRRQKMTRVEQVRAALKSGESRKVSDIIHYLLSTSPDVILPKQPESQDATATCSGNQEDENEVS
jgi:hypothetical protein